MKSIEAVTEAAIHRSLNFNIPNQATYILDFQLTDTADI